METVTYRSDNGLFIVFEDMPPYVLTSIDTMGVGSTEDQNMAIGGVFSTYSSGYDRRNVPLEVAILSNGFGELAQLKQRMCNIIDLHHQGTLVYQNDTGAYALRGRFIEMPAGSDRAAGCEKFQLNFQSTQQPKWKERDERVCRMGAVVGGLRFPFTINPKIRFGTYTTRFSVLNDTYDNLPVRVVVIGTAEYVSIINESSGQHMQFNRAITAQQMLEVDTEKGTAFVKSADTGATIENASHYLTLDSDYWHLQRGLNTIKLDGGGQTSRPLGYLFWQKQFGGI